MEYVIENEILKVTVTTWGAQVKSVVRKSDGVEHIWNADKEVWGYHAPILFPHTGRVVDNIIEVDGKEYASGQHGFARLMEHTLVEHSADRVILELTDSPETMEKFPFSFRLVSTISIEGDTLSHTLRVVNTGKEKDLAFGIGYHPAFTVPFDEAHHFSDYELRFSHTESPICINNLPKGLMHGDLYMLEPNIQAIPIDEHLFDNDSHCMVNLRSKTLGLYEKGTGRAVICDIEDFPYTLLWSKPGEPKFVCIEPWHSLPSPENGSRKWEEKPAAAVLQPGRCWSCCLKTRFAR